MSRKERRPSVANLAKITKYGASSSIIVLDFDVEFKKFRVIKRTEVPRGEYSLDHAVRLTIETNEIYNPSWIFVDRGYGDYQLERLHIYGEEHPHTGLKCKVVGWQFKNNIDVMNPVTGVTTKEPLKPFMVNQLALAFERDRFILSPFDETLHRQLVDYVVERISQNGMPVYTSKNEHFVDALGLAYLAFVLKFPDIAANIKKPHFSNQIKTSNVSLGQSRVMRAFHDIQSPSSNPWEKRQKSNDDDDLPGDKPTWKKIPMGRGTGAPRLATWGSRTGRGFGGRKSW